MLSLGRLSSQENKESTVTIHYSSTFEYTQKIREEIKAIKTLKPEDFFRNINQYRSKLEKYFLQKKKVCNGELSTFILSEGKLKENLPNKKVRKLSKDERKLCFLEMKALQMTYINNMFLAREKYLIFLHERRVSELRNAKEKSIQSLQSAFSRNIKIKKKKRRRSSSAP